MVSLPEAECLLFLCSPRVKSLEDMHRIGLFFSDLALHDPVRGLILISHQRRRERELVKKLDEASNHLKVHTFGILPFCCVSLEIPAKNCYL
ncbi:hypothetical protein HPB48_004472 [Haemaphysalis longicornis]|uniref:guanylate cyclase n=1 Tax=Haemaphysalis longicornis TaxID=44386 RepID=A0A9J6GHT0_HAELO|nr:hypothetical protein HPB48_004472 [Haemaphysalis longicornis]